VGDSVNDILCAQAAGVRSVAVTWGTKPERVRTLCTPDHIVDDWGSLAVLLQRMSHQGDREVAERLVEVGSNGA
jgi:phosphoglycolate phosphatase-like HAD superfamily hydrolase